MKNELSDLVGQKVGQKAEVAKIAKHKKIQTPLSDWILKGILVGTVGFEPTTPCTP
ncbi:hypothetical protein [Marinobacter sp. ATCH36]|uniref:hypothetical protein n=1 Tax=Marinobacter sp. ATCH36 TaxID=2945106 RepID=UPI0020228527|nr:hypothetical protein [Marinobacter sp. ATCH36]MCL7944053.1 hypothetical protein [Marinobacter sp. ATCH36]